MWCKSGQVTLNDTKEDCKVLQEDLHRLEKQEKAWGMEFHPGKCNSMSITRARSPFEHRYTLKGHILEDVKEAKYLGLMLWSNLTWNTHIRNITSKANKLLGFLRRNLKIRNESTSPMKNCQRKAKFFLTWDLSQRYCPCL